MSGFGFSPSDIIGAVRIVNKAVGALKAEDGAQSQYQALKLSHHDLHVAVEALSRACLSLDVPSSSALSQSLEHLLKNQEHQEQQISKYEVALGEGSPRKKSKDIRRKLQWAFQGDQDVRDSDTRSRGAVDATILRNLLVQNDVGQGDHAAMKTYVSSTTETAVTKMEQNIADHASTLADKMRADYEQHVDAIMMALSSMMQSQEQTITQAIHRKISSTATFPVRRKRQLKPQVRRKQVCKGGVQSKHLTPALSRISLPGSFSSEYQHSDVLCASNTRDSTALSRDDTSSCLFDASRAILALLLTILYASPRMRKIAREVWSSVQGDPVLALLGLICAALIQRCLSHFPMHISLLSDSSITFVDVFGIEFKVPYRQCEQFEFFHGFLEYHFRQRPGLLRVTRKRYRLLLGDAQGHMIGRLAWTRMVKPKCRISMAMLLHSPNGRCAKCSGELESQMQRQIRICITCHQEYRIETLCDLFDLFDSFSVPKFIEHQDIETEEPGLPRASSVIPSWTPAADLELKLFNNMTIRYIAKGAPVGYVMFRSPSLPDGWF